MTGPGTARSGFLRPVCLVMVPMLGLALLALRHAPTATRGAQPPDDAYARDLAGYARAFAESEGRKDLLGLQGCASCHDRKDPPRTDQEQLAWYAGGFGPHARAYETLMEARSDRMAGYLHAQDNKGSKATERADCLACHSERAGGAAPRSGVMTTGVGCEMCHGRSSAWDTPHRFPDWKTKSAREWLDAGMYDTRSLVRWAPKCLECHMGGPHGRRAPHSLLAAGHPQLTFELAGDTFMVPKHWRDERTRLEGEDPAAYYARLWAVGQAVTLYESMRLLIEWADSSQAPDYALFDCFSCHHEYRVADSRSPALPRFGPPGEPKWDMTPWIGGRALLRAFEPERADEAEALVGQILQGLRLHAAEPAPVRAAATRLRELAEVLAHKLGERRFSREDIVGLCRQLTAEPDYVLGAGPRATEQTYRALRALYLRAWPGERPANDEAIRRELAELERLLYGQDQLDDQARTWKEDWPAVARERNRDPVELELELRPGFELRALRERIAGLSTLFPQGPARPPTP
jgi:hypothetical protein